MKKSESAAVEPVSTFSRRGTFTASRKESS